MASAPRSCCPSACSARAGGLPLRREAGALLRMGRHEGGWFTGGILLSKGFCVGLGRDGEGSITLCPWVLEFSPH